jgi:pimeloyl-ACP methyl ester carboxylesterase
MRWTWLFSLVAMTALSAVAVAQTPPGPEAPPPALDYADARNWVCRPDHPCRDDLTTAVLEADGRVRLERFEPAADPKIDCFYVYPTVSMSRDLIAPPGVTEAERRAVRQQTLRLTAVCRLYVPFYRQFTVGGMEAHLRPSPATVEAGKTRADADVLAAWDHYLAHDNHGRGVVLIGHSQGAGVLQDLIRRRIEGQPAQARIVSAILPGSFLTAPKGQDVGGTFKSLPACRRPDQTGCVIVFNSYRSDVLIDRKDVFPIKRGEQALCVNLAALAGGPGVLKPYLSTTGETIIPDFTGPQAPWTTPPTTTVDAPFVTLPGFYTAECKSDEHGTYLAIVPHPQRGDRRAHALVGDWMQDGKRNVTMGLHLIDLNLVMGNLVEVLGQQAEAWCSTPGKVCAAE